MSCISYITFCYFFFFFVDAMKGSSDTEIGGTLPQRIQSCLDTIDIFLQQPHPVLSSMIIADKRVEIGTKISVVEAVANIMGIKALESINPSVTLADLGMDSLMGTEIKQTLERNYDLILSALEIRTLTFGKLQQLDTPTAEEQVNTTDSEEDIVEDFLFQVNSSELVPIKSLVQLETKSSKGQPIFIVHAIEGTQTPFKTLASELERPVWSFQCIENSPLESVSALAAFYVKEMQKNQAKEPYHVAGYSFGACIAFEMAVQLEKAGKAVVLTLLDGSPAYVKLHSVEIGKLANQDDVSANGYRKSLSYFIRQFNKKINFIQVFLFSIYYFII